MRPDDEPVHCRECSSCGVHVHPAVVPRTSGTRRVWVDEWIRFRCASGFEHHVKEEDDV